MSNYDYLVELNKAAGRVRGAVHNHPIFPWVCDFKQENGGWRDLSKTKYRLTKGDDQLGQNFNHLSHHIPEVLSDIGYMVYKARVESKTNLCKHVRSKWVPREYPVSMVRMYEWTPDECIPEFYDDPSIMVSHHSDMPDLELPSFVSSPQEFIKWHRRMLESDEVSRHLHEWIDLNFGQAVAVALDSLNVHMCFSEPKRHRLCTNGMVRIQLFHRPHPKRLRGSSGNALFEGADFELIQGRLPILSDVSEELLNAGPFSGSDILKTLFNVHPTLGTIVFRISSVNRLLRSVLLDNCKKNCVSHTKSLRRIGPRCKLGEDVAFCSQTSTFLPVMRDRSSAQFFKELNIQKVKYAVILQLLDRRFLLPASIAYGTSRFLKEFLPTVIEAVASLQIDRSVVAKESVVWLSKRYGPVISARFITANLLRVLGSCYSCMALIGSNQEPNASVFTLPLVGDECGARVEACLTEIAATYSVTFITVQYLPFCVDLVEQATRRLTPPIEAGLLAAFRIVRLSAKAMSDHQLMNYLEVCSRKVDNIDRYWLVS
ncbi:unnamed protein product [Heligmosomoides polygyrus]|uniref:BEACH domain-containing protein n=1 Tax=Heligmosomoides polygyrus TaxID=6339 RepID=A0A3P8GTQ0_HELPZ|nr:unnamed protein product [Heligmosomoides polygyrus]